MRTIKYALFAALAFVLLSSAPKSQAQVSVGVNIGAAPACPYGYYGYAPYNCAPYGYYGPEWFTGGIFLGAGPWFHGPHGFYGHINQAYDPRYGYHGGYPNRGEGWHEPPDHWQSFHASHYSDEHGSYHTEAEHEHYTHR